MAESAMDKFRKNFPEFVGSKNLRNPRMKTGVGDRGAHDLTLAQGEIVAEDEEGKVLEIDPSHKETIEQMTGLSTRKKSNQ